MSKIKMLRSLLLLLFAINASAKTDDVLTSITEDMKHFSDVATQTKQNESYQPYIISVFKGDELEKLGVSNLKEALQLVPGVDMTTDNLNNQISIFRGSNPSAYGQTKLFIDGLLVNNLLFDSYSEYLGMPIEMIKRVEVVRGPGSKTDGVNVYAGSVNIITYAEDIEGFESKDKIVLKHGSYNYNMGGFVKTFKTEDLKVFIDFYYQKDKKTLPSGPDGVSKGSLGAANTSLSRSGDAPLWSEDYSLGVNIIYKDFSLKTRLLDHTKGAAYGLNFALPQYSDRVKLPSYNFELGYDKKISDFEIDIKGGAKFDAYDSKQKVAPDDLNLSGVIFVNGVYAEHYALQKTLYQSSYLKYSGFENHYISGGYRVLSQKTIDMTSKLSNRTTGNVALVDYTETLPFLDKNAKRDITIFSMQDDYAFSDAISFLYGFNYETTTYQDAGMEPRISMVYKHDANNIYKAMYSRSHRNPSWQEMFTKNNLARVGSTNLRPEKVDAFELAYIKKLFNDSYVQTNLFYLLNKDQIYNSPTNPLFRNVLDTDLYGLEVEYKGRLSSSDNFYLNYSYVDGSSYLKDEQRSTALTNVAHHLAKGYYTHNFTPSLSLSGVAKYVSSKARITTDTREKLKGYTTVDTSLYYKNKEYDFTVMASLKNIFDERVAYPSPVNSYSEDYVQERRNFLITLTKEF